jgi:isochorismate synthase EntC
MAAILQGVCSEVKVEREKSILKQGAVQHLYGRLAGVLKDDTDDAALLVCDAFPAAP